MAFPAVRAVGTIVSGTGTVTMTEPAGSADGDLQLAVIETDGAETPTCTGWANVPNSPQTADTGSASDTKLSVLYRIRSGAGTLLTNDPGEHIVTRMIGITVGTFDPANPFNAGGGGTDTTADTSASCPGGTTTVTQCLVIVCFSNGDTPGVNGTANYSGYTNANLGSITERIDNTRTVGGGIGACSGTYAGPGSYGSTTATYAVASLKGMVSIAIAPVLIPDLAMARR